MKGFSVSRLKGSSVNSGMCLGMILQGRVVQWVETVGFGVLGARGFKI